MRKRTPVGAPLSVRLNFHSHRTTSGCREWTGATRSDGYGVIRISGRTLRAHRVAWELAHGEIPDAMELDHLCHNRRCIEPAHLRVADRVTNGQNLSGAHVDSRTGVRGVYMFRGKFVGRVCAQGKHYRAGTFDTLDEAAEAVHLLREKVHRG